MNRRIYFALIAGAMSLSMACQSPSIPTPIPTPLPSPSPTATPTPEPVAACPSMNQWKGYVFHCTLNGVTTNEPNGRPNPRIGGNCTIDTTQFFNVPGGPAPCNGEHDNCGLGHQCEDPRGPEFRVLEHHAEKHEREANPNLFQFINMGPGKYRLEIRPRGDLVDYLGRPVLVDGPGSFVVSFVVDD